MHYITIIQSINKVAIIAFFAILVLIVIEVSMMFKDNKKKSVVKIPDFDSKFGAAAKVATTKMQVNNPKQKKSMLRLLVISTLLLILFGLMAVFGNYMLQQQQSAITPTPTAPVEPRIELVESGGILIFNKKWEKIALNNIPVNEGDMLYIGVATVRGADIDKARIRINKKVWGINDELTRFNKDKGIYYMEYAIATEESSLQIDAQLHSKENGWLTE